MIHPTAIVSPTAEIGDNVKIGAFSIIYDHVKIGSGTVIESHCELGLPTPLAKNKELVIGQNSIIRSKSIFYAGSVFGERFETGHRVTVRENTKAGINFRLGTASDIQGDCVIGDYVRCPANVHICKTAEVGSFVWIFPFTCLTNDPRPPSHTMIGPKIEDYAIVATMCVLLPGTTVGRGAFVSAHSCVTRDVEPGMLVAGSPAKPLRKVNELKLKDGTQAYPWVKHFHRGYPEDVVALWMKEDFTV